MALLSSQTLSCAHCGGTATVEVYSSVNVGEDPELLADVRSGRLFVWQCPHCGCNNLIGRPFMYHDPVGKHMVWLCTDDAGSDAVAEMFGPQGALSDYTARIVDSAGDLIEKVKIFDAGLDDVVMEMVKHVTLIEMGRDIKGLRFLSMDGADGEIALAYPKDGDMQMIGIGFNVYEDCAAILRRNPHIRQMATGLVRINEGWVERFFE